MRGTNAHPSLMDVECVNAAPAPRAFFKHVGRARAQTYVQWLDPEWSGDPQRPLSAKRCQTQTPYIAPTVGLEPTTTRLRAFRSAD